MFPRMFSDTWLPLFSLFSLLSICSASPVDPASLPAGGVFKLEARRASLKRHSNNNTSIPGVVGLLNDNDTGYFVNVTLGGEVFSLILDTGSTDLVVNTAGRNVKLTNQTDLIAKGRYGAGAIDGTELFAELRLGDFVVPSQAFVNVTKLDLKPGASLEDGLLGISFDQAMIWYNFSVAYGPEAANTLGRAPITNIWALNPSVPPFFDLYLTRTESGDADGSLLTIGQHAPGFESVAYQPKLPLLNPYYWNVALEGVVINGRPFALNASSIPGVPAGALVTVLDSGSSLAYVPAALAEAVYGSIPGSTPPQDGSFPHWRVPCNSSANVTFIFGGQEVNLHPLDVVVVEDTQPITIPDTDVTINTTVCAGTLAPIAVGEGANSGFDLLLGDAFLKNVYVSFNYGDDYDRANSSHSSPYVQMLPTTDRDASWQEWLSARARTLMDHAPALSPALVEELTGSSTNSTSPQSTTGAVSVAGAISEADASADGGDSDSKKQGPLVLGLLGANLAVGIILLGVVLAMCIRGVKGRSVGPKYAPVRVRETASAGEYEETHLKYGD